MADPQEGLIEVCLPAMGETMDEGTVAAWTAHSGDFVRRGQVIAQIETNKAVFELEAPAEGRLRVLVRADETVPVLTVLAVIETVASAETQEAAGPVSEEPVPEPPLPEPPAVEVVAVPPETAAEEAAAPEEILEAAVPVADQGMAPVPQPEQPAAEPIVEPAVPDTTETVVLYAAEEAATPIVEEAAPAATFAEPPAEQPASTGPFAAPVEHPTEEELPEALTEAARPAEAVHAEPESTFLAPSPAPAPASEATEVPVTVETAAPVIELPAPKMRSEVPAEREEPSADLLGGSVAEPASVPEPEAAIAPAVVQVQAELAEPAEPEVLGEGEGEGEGERPSPSEPGYRLPEETPGRLGSSPRARRLAREEGLDLEQVTGSGPLGRVVESDVLSALEARRAEQPAPGAAASVIRRVVARRMAESARVTAPVTLVTEADATELALARQRLGAPIQTETGCRLTYDVLLARIVGLALREHPALNAHLTESGLERMEAVNVGIAVDTPRGLLVPVLRDAASRSLATLACEAAGLVERAQSGAILPGEMEGGTFTITNLGGYGIDFFTPLINLPEVAILGVGRIVPRPVVRDDRVAVRKMIGLSLTFDHRAVDGGPSARFLQRVVEMIQSADPDLLL